MVAGASTRFACALSPYTLLALLSARGAISESEIIAEVPFASLTMQAVLDSLFRSKSRATSRVYTPSTKSDLNFVNNRVKEPSRWLKSHLQYASRDSSHLHTPCAPKVEKAPPSTATPQVL
jgi:hypothetical protein